MRRAGDGLLVRHGLGLVLVGFLGVPSFLPAQTIQKQVPQLRDVGVAEHLGDLVPGDLEFRAEDGTPVTMGQLLAEKKPVILTLNYYRCPMLCGLQLKGLLQGLKDLKWTMGENFKVITVSIDPLEGPELAAAKKKSSLREYGRPGAAEGWRFLTGSADSIQRLAAAVGFGYHWDRETNQYAHPAVAVLLSPEGRIVRYLYGIEYPAKTLKLALTEAGEGVIGSPWDRFILTCFHYDPSTRRYAPVAERIMRAGGAATVALLGVMLGVFWVRDRRRRRPRKGED